MSQSTPSPAAIAELVKRMESVATMLDPEERFQNEWILIIREGTAALTALAEARGAGMVSVPQEPTEAMLRAMNECDADNEGEYFPAPEVMRAIYAAMIRAALAQGGKK